VARIAEQVGDTAYFQLRSGFDTICLARCVGAYPVKILTVDVGMRRPLGMGAGSLALLAFIPDGEIEAVLAVNLDELATYAAPGVALDADLVWSLVQETRRVGHSYVEDVFIPGMAAVGMPIRRPDGQPVGAFAVAAVTNRLGRNRRPIVIKALEREVRTIEARLGKSTAGSRTPPLRPRSQSAHVRSQANP
jgi:DNA-binding IclR family transcriptional regulator